MPTASYAQQAYVNSTSWMIQGSSFGYVRKLIYGSDWTQIRLGVLLSAEEYLYVVANHYSHTVALGVCSGSVYPVWSPQCLNFFGYFPQLSYTQEIAGASGRYLNCAGAPYTTAACKKRNVTLTTGDIGANAMLYGKRIAPNPRRTPFFVEIAKGSPNYTLKIYFCPSTRVDDTDFTRANLIDGLKMAAPINVGGVAFTTSLTASVAMDESTGELDSVCWWMNGPDMPINVGEFGAYKMA